MYFSEMTWGSGYVLSKYLENKKLIFGSSLQLMFQCTQTCIYIYSNELPTLKLIRGTSTA